MKLIEVVLIYARTAAEAEANPTCAAQRNIYITAEHITFPDVHPWPREVTAAAAMLKFAKEELDLGQRRLPIVKEP